MSCCIFFAKAAARSKAVILLELIRVFFASIMTEPRHVISNNVAFRLV